MGRGPRPGERGAVTLTESVMKWILRWLWRKDSESASCVCIDLADTMSDKDLREMSDYFRAVIENREARANGNQERRG